MSEPIISVSGLRGIIGDSLTPDLAIRFVAAYLAGLPAGPIVLTRDGRTTGAMLADAVRSAICSAGRDVLNGEIAATPTTGVLVRHTRAVGGIQISASHNPPEYNGLKLFDDRGQVLTAALGNEVLARYRAGTTAWADYRRIGQVIPVIDPHTEHERLVLGTVDVERIRRRRFKVLLDANHGAGSLLGQVLLTRLDCEIVPRGATPDGRFAHPPEPTAENLRDVCLEVRAAGADVGFCQDPDADRLAVIDETGRYLGEEYTLALCLDHVLRSRSGPFVMNCATSRMNEDIATRYGAPCFRSAVGEANVVERMRAENAVFGGEGNGGPIDPRVGYVRDSFVGMALILDVLAERELPLSRLADELPRYEIHKGKVTLDRAAIPTALSRLEQHFAAEARCDRQDGLRLDWPRRWLLVRASNTEPIVRVIAEASSLEEAVALCRDAERVMRGD